MTDDTTGTYLLDRNGAQAWWAPPGGFPRQPLEIARQHQHPGASEHAGFARAILLHATGQSAAADDHDEAFARFITDHAEPTDPLQVPFERVSAWLEHHHLRLAPGWTTNGPGPTISRDTAAGSSDRYVVSLDGHPVLDLELLPAGPDGVIDTRVGLRDVRELGGYTWDGVVQVTTSEDEPVLATDARVTADALPFGGWAVQVDGYDVAIVERAAHDHDQVRVAIYDRAPGERFLATEHVVRHQPAGRPSVIAARLASFTPEPRAALAR